MASRELNVAVVGATGAVGREMLAVLEQRAFPIKELRALASEKSDGAELEFCGKTITVATAKPHSFEGIDIALFSAGAAVSKELAPEAVKHGAVVIDNSSAFRMDDSVPLIVPEVNADVLRTALHQRRKGSGLLVSNPNCSTIQLVVVLKPISDLAGLHRVVVSTYQSVSGAGQKGMDELAEQVTGLFGGREIEVKHFPHQIAFNCIPHIDTFLPDGSTKEEAKIINESRKILGLPKLRITSTAVRVPVFACHGESVNIETEKALAPEAARDLLRTSPGVLVEDDPAANEYPLNMAHAGGDAVAVGRIRRDDSIEKGLNMWIVSDNLRKGAALNAVQIAEVALNDEAF